jgi:hypothetical protein
VEWMLVVNLDDMMQTMSGGAYRSVEHRVVVPSPTAARRCPAAAVPPLIPRVRAQLLLSPAGAPLTQPRHAASAAVLGAPTRPSPRAW